MKPEWEPWMKWGFETMHECFVEAHMAGDVAGEKIVPMSKEQAEAAWITNQHIFVKLIEEDQEVRTKAKASWDVEQHT